MGLSSTSLRELRRLTPYRLGSGSDRRKTGRGRLSALTVASPQEDLPYNVELWDVDKKSVEQVLAPA
jgi:hypothetical protein